MNMGQNQTTKSHTRIFHIGLGPRDLLVLESIFRQPSALADRYIFGAATETDPVDLLFVNADDQLALGQWEKQRSSRPELVGIMVSEHEQNRPGQAWVRRPFNLRDLVSIIEVITAASAPQATVAGEKTKSLRVLVVDDSFPARQFMKFKLEELASRDMQLSVDFADSGEKAVEAARAAPYDLIFLDVVMPGMDGYDTCSLIKTLGPTRVAMLTSLTAPVDFQRGKKAGCDYYLTKPPHDTDLRTMLTITSFRKLTAMK